MSEEVIDDFDPERIHSGECKRRRYLECPSVRVVKKFRETYSWLRSWSGWYVEAMIDEKGKVSPSHVEWSLRAIRKYAKTRVGQLNDLLDTYAKIKKGGLNYKLLENFNKTRKWDVNRTLARMDRLLTLPVEDRFKLENLVPESYKKVRSRLMQNLIDVISQRTHE